MISITEIKFCILTRNNRLNIVKSALQKRKEYEVTKRTIKEADNTVQ